jgi:DNA repair protein SbcD/Mre11
VTLRLLHTSDWHLGRSLHDESLLSDQRHALGQVLAAVRDERPDVLVVAGDIYDRAVPPPEAVTLLDEVLVRLAELGVPVVAIGGNHDSAERLAFGARLLSGRGIHLRGLIAEAGRPVTLPSLGVLYAVPYVEPDAVRALTGDDALRGHAAATERVVAPLRDAAATQALPTVLLAHAFVQGASETPDSERPLSVGGSGAVQPGVFEGFDYVALGHLHAPQAVADRLRYSGSLLKYSFAEAGHRKGLWLVEVERGATPRAVELPLTPRRDVVRLRGTLKQLLADPSLERHRGDLVEATLEDEGYVVNARQKLLQRFDHVLNVVRANLGGSVPGRFAGVVNAAAQDDLELFRAFFGLVADQPPGAAREQVFGSALEAERQAARDE